MYKVLQSTSSIIIMVLALLSILLLSWVKQTNSFVRNSHLGVKLGDGSISASTETIQDDLSTASTGLFDQFVEFIKEKQASIVQDIEEIEEGSATFTVDEWGVFAGNTSSPAGGITRVIQGGNVVEKGACSLTLIQDGVLTAERATTIRARQKDSVEIKEGMKYSAAALSMVLHTRSPLIPTFRSDVRVFIVKGEDGTCLAWYGGGADLTPYYLDADDIMGFHKDYKSLCDSHLNSSMPGFSYQSMKQACDDYFFLPARQEHRGTGGIFFDDLPVSPQSTEFVKGVADTWMPSWFPIVRKHMGQSYTDQQKSWQLLRRGRYLEFNLLYDRGVKFGLANANPRVEGVMVSAPPVIAYEYNHEIAEGSPEAKLTAILKKPCDWV